MKDIVFAAQEPLNHSDIELVGESIALLMAIDPKVGRPLIEPLLHHPSEMIRAGVVTQLAEKGDLTFVPSISKALLEDMDGTVRYCAVAALEYMPRIEGLPALEYASKNDAGEDYEGRSVKDAARRAIHHINSSVA